MIIMASNTLLLLLESRYEYVSAAAATQLRNYAMIDF